MHRELLLAYRDLVKENKIDKKLVVVGRNANNPKKKLNDLIYPLNKKGLIKYFEFFPQEDLIIYIHLQVFIYVSPQMMESH